MSAPEVAVRGLDETSTTKKNDQCRCGSVVFQQVYIRPREKRDERVKNKPGGCVRRENRYK